MVTCIHRHPAVISSTRVRPMLSYELELWAVALRDLQALVHFGGRANQQKSPEPLHDEAVFYCDSCVWIALYSLRD